MSNLKAVATTIFGDEKAFSLLELHLQSPNNRGVRRYQIIEVNRGDKITEWRKDMGPAKNWKGVKQLSIPSLWIHSVDELLDLADELRYTEAIDVKDFLELDTYKPA